ncbi:MAG: hypothetical protein GX663_10780 [Clostridiales bacterium]|nr:hypothetical protein [Clostridiales bacterium]
MKESLWGYWLIILGIFVIVILMLIQSFTTTNTQDYYLLKEVTEAAVKDSVDYGYFRIYKELRIHREKFIENFVRRFSETVNLNKTYDIEFYAIYEAPPKVSIKVTTKTESYAIGRGQSSFDVVNKVNAILELRLDEKNYKKNYGIED